jgi:rhomboid protease GlpG
MRQIGTLPSETQARIFVDYILTQDIRANVESDGEAWALWVFDEDRVSQAKAELDTFRENPNAEKYAQAQAKAEALRNREIQQYREAKKKIVRASDTWNQSYLQRCPVTITLIVMSVFVAMATTYPDDPLNFGTKLEPARSWLSFAPLTAGPRPDTFYVPHKTFEAIFHGEVWRLFTPMFLHFGPLHLLFNMMWLQDLGGVIEVRRGRWKYLALVLLIAGISNTAQDIVSGPSFGGMSGVVFGLFGYIWMQSRFVPNAGFYMPPNIVMLMLIWMAICYSGVMGGIANTAHTAGLIVGMVAGYAPKLWRDLSR